MKVKKILVPIDLSDVSQKALDYAIEFSRPFAAELIVLHVVEPVYYASMANIYGPVTDLSMLFEEQRREAKKQLAKIDAQVRKSRVPVRTVLGYGSPYLEILEGAKKVKADLIIMATHGRTGFSHMLIGSVAERVVRRATCPGLTVRVADTAQSGKPGARRRKEETTSR